jgi:hypothetical protein
MFKPKGFIFRGPPLPLFASMLINKALPTIKSAILEHSRLSATCIYISIGVIL